MLIVLSLSLLSLEVGRAKMLEFVIGGSKELGLLWEGKTAEDVSGL